MKIINMIGYILLVPGPITLFWNLAKLAQGNGNDDTITFVLVGLIVTIIGLVMGNFKEEWITKEDL